MEPVKYIDWRDFSDEQSHYYDEILQSVFSVADSFFPYSYIYWGIFWLVILFIPFLILASSGMYPIAGAVGLIGLLIMFRCIILEIRALRNWQNRINKVLEGHDDIGFVRGSQFYLYRQWQHYAGRYWDAEKTLRGGWRVKFANPPGGIDDKSWPLGSRYK